MLLSIGCGRKIEPEEKNRISFNKTGEDTTMNHLLTLESVLELSRNFMESRILLTAAELNLFSLLSPRPLAATEVAERLPGNLRAVTILLDALAAMGFLVKQEERYQCLPPISDFLSPDHSDSILPMVLHAAHLWRRWTHLTDAVSGSETRSAASPAPGEEELRAFIGAMHAVAAPLASRIAKAANPAGARALLDVGGASGTYTIAFLQTDPKMKATLFDRPPVIEMARKSLAEAGMLDRVTLKGGDFYADEFPSGHDLVLLSAIIHQNSPKQNEELFKKVLRSLQPGGRIVIRDHIMAPDRTQPLNGAVFAVNMLLATEGGNTYTFEEVERGLAQAGFIRVRLIQTGEHMDGLVEGFKP
jgi:predicted O-methyltransferase YrrM